MKLEQLSLTESWEALKGNKNKAKIEETISSIRNKIERCAGEHRLKTRGSRMDEDGFPFQLEMDDCLALIYGILSK